MMKKLKQEESEQKRVVLELVKYAQTPVAAVSLGSDEMSLGSDEMSLWSNENSDMRPCAMGKKRAHF